MTKIHGERSAMQGGTFDYIIVGGGSAGCVLAHRLSADPGVRVLLIEAGPPPRSPYIRIPMGLGKLLSDPSMMWYYPTEPEAATADMSRIWLRGKVLGGSSAVNGMVYCRGDAQDYDDWAAHGATGWDWNTMLAAFRDIEDHALGSSPWRGVGGPLPVSIQPYRSALTDAVLEGCSALGTPIKEDLNEPPLEGVGYSPVTIARGRRMSSYEAFVRPIRHRRNLSIVTDTLVSRILLDGRRATGVKGVRAGHEQTWQARRAVILSAGTIGSPKILQLSGIGPASHLQALGIPVACNSPGVGQNLSEHKAVWLEYRLRGNTGLNHQFRGWRLVANALRYALTRGGPLASTVNINGFIRTRSELVRPDAQINIWALTAQKGIDSFKPEPFPAINAGGWPLRPESRGSIMLRSADPNDMPVIRPNFLATETDRAILIGLFRYLRAAFRQAPLADFIAAETLPGTDVVSDDDILAAAHCGENGFHATGTCRMGSDAEAVVDPHLRVNGIDGLRVVDASVMPTQVSSGVNGPVMALAWQAANLIAADDGD